MAEEEESVVSKPSPVSDILCLLYQKDKCGKKPKQGRTRSLKRLDKQVSLKLQNQVDATCWPRRVLVMHRVFAYHPCLQLLCY